MDEWTWAAASRRGSAHAERGERRQDAFRITAPRGSHSFVAFTACDGAGSARCGGEGAALTAWTMTECARRWLLAAIRMPEPEDVSGWVTLARARIAFVAERHGLTPDDFATTLVMAISNGALTLTVHIGDGAIVGRIAALQAWVPLSWPEHGEYASTTHFVTDRLAPCLRIRLHDVRIDRLTVMTDGLERLAIDFVNGVPHARFFEAMFRPVVADFVQGRNHAVSDALAVHLDSARVLARTDDDKTLILAARI